jgi:hypothetical protein
MGGLIIVIGQRNVLLRQAEQNPIELLPISQTTHANTFAYRKQSSK